MIAAKVIYEIASFASFAPARNRVNLEEITAIEQILPDVPQVEVFDPAFHSQNLTLPYSKKVYGASIKPIIPLLLLGF